MGAQQSSPVGGGGSGEAVQMPCANGFLRKGSRVQTQYTRAEGGDDRWYSGTITQVYANQKAKIHYDDGDRWTGDTMHIYLLSPASQPQGPPMAAPTMQPDPGNMVMTAVVPPGVMPGQPMPVQGPNGMPFHVNVPPGVMPGQSFQFQVPLQPQAPVATAVAVPVHAPPVVYGQPVVAQPVQATKY